MTNFSCMLLHGTVRTCSLQARAHITEPLRLYPYLNRLLRFISTLIRTHHHPLPSPVGSPNGGSRLTVEVASTIVTMGPADNRYKYRPHLSHDTSTIFGNSGVSIRESPRHARAATSGCDDPVSGFDATWNTRGWVDEQTQGGKHDSLTSLQVPYTIGRLTVAALVTRRAWGILAEVCAIASPWGCSHLYRPRHQTIASPASLKSSRACAAELGSLSARQKKPKY